MMRSGSMVQVAFSIPGHGVDARERAARGAATLASSLLASGAIQPPTHSLELPPPRARRPARKKR